MASIIDIGKEWLRISPKDVRKLEYSNNGGLSWGTRIIFTAHFKELIEGNGELLAQTDKGLFYSRNDGHLWGLRHHCCDSI